MTWTLSPYLVSYLLAAAVTLGIVALLWPRRRLAGCLPLILLMSAASLWALANGLELAAPTLPQKLFWARLQYLAKVTIPSAWLVTALYFAGHGRWLTWRRLALLSIVPAATLVLTWTTETHGLMMRDFGLDAAGPVPLVSKQYGPWFWVHVSYSYALIAFATLAVLASLFKFPHVYRGQAAAWLIAAAVPLVGNASYVFGIDVLHALDLSSIAFAVSGVVLYWAFRRFRLFDLMPAARETIVEAMSEGVLVLDARGRIIDLNPAAERILGLSAAAALGTAAPDIVPSLAQPAVQPRSFHGEITEVELGADGAERTYELRISSLQGSGAEPHGCLVMLLDVTENRRLQRQLEARSIVDDLTGLYNRRGFFEMAEQRLGLARREGRPVVLTFVDVDRLKQVNDEQGHAAGDRLLVDAAKVLRSAFRDRDIIGRIGGDEFAVLVLDADPNDKTALADRLAAALETANLAAPNVVAFSVGFSSGSTAALDELLKKADSAMYREKRSRQSRRGDGATPQSTRGSATDSCLSVDHGGSFVTSTSTGP